MKIPSNIIILILFGFLISSCRSKFKSNTIAKFDLSYQQNWQYFKSEDTLTLEVINHLKAEVLCGTVASASITIGKLKKDTIRVINLCNMEDYKIGDVVKFIPADRPNFSVSLPYSTIYNPTEKELNPSFFDLNVKKTTYGYAIR